MDWVLRYWAEAVFGAAVSLLGVAVRKLQKKSAEQDALRLGIRALLRDRLLQSYLTYSERGYCPIYARENIELMYEQYEALGGNGTVSGLVEKMTELPYARPE